jgi:uncharacterized membrane-anchored protein
MQGILSFEKGLQMSFLGKGVAWACLALACVAPHVFAEEQLSPEQQHAKQVFQSLGWIHSGTAPVGSKAQFVVPAGYGFLNPDDTRKLMELMRNPSHGQEYLIAPEGMSWFAVLEFEDTGYIKDDEKIEPDALLESVRKGTEAGNAERKARGWAPLTIVGWRFPPRYDQQSKRLEWAIEAQSEGKSVVNYNTRILGRHGVTSAAVVADPQDLDQAVGAFKTVIQNFSYVDGERYAEYKQGDKVAEYGLAALVAGGAAAVAVKSGAAKWLWKLLVAVGIAAIGGVKALFGRKRS